MEGEMISFFSVVVTKELLFSKLKKPVPAPIPILKKLLGADKESKNLSKSFIRESITAVVSRELNKESIFPDWEKEALHNTIATRRIEARFCIQCRLLPRTRVKYIDNRTPL